MCRAGQPRAAPRVARDERPCALSYLPVTAGTVAPMMLGAVHAYDSQLLVRIPRLCGCGRVGLEAQTSSSAACLT